MACLFLIAQALLEDHGRFIVTVLLYQLWRYMFIGDGSAELARDTYDRL
jgi:hypothetical protein